MASAVSTPPSDPRHSTSSQPSQTSSATLHSAHDPHHHDHAESSKRRRLLHRAEGASQPAQTSADGNNTRAQGLLGADLATDRERDRRRRLPRRSGGFLLDAALPGSSARRRSREDGADEKGKRSGSRHASKSPSSYDGSRRAYSRGSSSRSRPLSGETDVGASGNGHAPEDYGARTPENRQDKGQAMRDLGINVDAANEHGDDAGAPANAGIDPAQIIHMALNLSESRRRNLGHGQLVAPSIGTRSRRATSAGMGIPNTPMQGSFHEYGVGGSLKQHLQQQRRISRNMSPIGGRMSTPASRHVSVSSPNALLDHGIGPQPSYTFTAATLARAEKAKTYVELGAEYRRLLQNLQPLKLDSESNYTYSAFSTPGSPHVELKKIHSNTGPDPLGRAYNPLQFIRNRKLRARERRKLDPDVIDFEEVDRVRMWIDTVEEATAQQKYRQDDKVLLPPFTPDPMLRSSHEQQNGDTKRPSVLLGKQKRPRMDWFTLPSEWLADAVWLEQDGHKYLIEDRNGNRIFPRPRSSMANPRLSREQARPSLDKRRTSTAGSAAGGGYFSEPRTNYSSEAESYRGRKKRHFLHNKEDSPERGKRLGWMSRGRSSSSSGLSSSDDDVSERRKKLDRRLSTQDENIGPLERHMKALLEDDTRVENGLSPILSSPEKHWGAGHSKASMPRRVMSETESDADGGGNKAAAKRATKRLTLLADKPPESRPSLDGLDSSAPNTPLSKTFSFGASSPPSRVASPDRKSRRSKLPFFRSEASAKGHRVDTTDFAVDPVNHKQPSGESFDPGRLSLDQPARSNSSVRPGLLKSHKTTDSLSSLASIQEGKVSRDRKEGKEKEPSSAVTRFFKDVGREGSKARKFIFKKDKPPEEADEMSSSDDGERSSTTDTEDDMSKSVIKRRPKPLSRTGTDTGLSDTSDVSERRPKYHAELPTFKSAASQDQKRDPSSAPSEGRRGRRRPARFDRLAPPRLDTNLSRSSSPGVVQLHPADDTARAHSEGPDSRSRSPSAVRRRMTKLLEIPGGVGRGGPPASQLSRFPAERKFSGSTPTRPSPQRHWSISDQETQRRASAHRISPASAIAATRTDITRIQALLLCSGIKAAELARRAHTVRDHPVPFLVRAADTAKANDPSNADIAKHTALVPTVARKEEHVLAARILASDLEASSHALVKAMDAFRTRRVRAMHQRCEALRIELGDRLTPRTHACADDADAFTREVTSGATLAVKAVADRVDAMGRARRRRMRWLRRFGWMMLEWCVLGVMWWVWLVVVIVRFGLGCARGVVRGVRWFLWLD